MNSEPIKAENLAPGPLPRQTSLTWLPYFCPSPDQARPQADRLTVDIRRFFLAAPSGVSETFSLMAIFWTALGKESVILAGY